MVQEHPHPAPVRAAWGPHPHAGARFVGVPCRLGNGRQRGSEYQRERNSAVLSSWWRSSAMPCWLRETQPKRDRPGHLKKRKPVVPAPLFRAVTSPPVRATSTTLASARPVPSRRCRLRIPGRVPVFTKIGPSTRKRGNPLHEAGPQNYTNVSIVHARRPVCPWRGDLTLPGHAQSLIADSAPHLGGGA